MSARGNDNKKKKAKKNQLRMSSPPIPPRSKESDEIPHTRQKREGEHPYFSLIESEEEMEKGKENGQRVTFVP